MGPSTPEQVEELIKLKFHEAAGMSESDFEDCAGRPKDRDAKTILVVSQNFICISKQCALLGIVNKLPGVWLQTLEDIVELPKKKFLYWCYGVEDGTANRGTSAERNLQQISVSHLLPAHLALALAIFRRNRAVIAGSNRLDVGGSRINGNLLPALLMGNGSAREHNPTLASSEISSNARPSYGMPLFERAE